MFAGPVLNEVSAAGADFNQLKNSGEI